MLRRFGVGPALTAGVMMLFPIAQASAQTPQGLRDLVGVRGSSGEQELARRGYEFISAQTGDDRGWTTWWNQRERNCIIVATVDGRYQAISSTPAPDCRRATSPPRPEPLPQPQPPRPTTLPTPIPPGASWPSGRQVDLGLVCFGEGERPALATRYGWTWNERRGRYDYGNRTELTSEQFDASVMIQIWDGGGRIKLPRRLIPPIHSRGNDSWWDLTDVSTTRNRITARYRLNGLNRPQIGIDRRSGRISIRGAYDYAFRGTCDAIDGRDHRRF